MSEFDVRKVVEDSLQGLDPDILEYIVSAVEEMSIDEKKSLSTLKEVISPFLLDTGFVDSDDEASKRCQAICLAFGGSGYKASKAIIQDDTPALLAVPIKMIDHSGLKTTTKASYGATFMASSSETSPLVPSVGSLNINSNSQYDVKAIPTTQKQMRKQKKDSEQLRAILQMEAKEREREAAELSKARMTAIKASRAVGKQALTGVSLDRFTLPHPSGTGDLLSEASLTLVPGRKYGLVGRNGAGKSTLLKALARYELDGLMHLRIMLVDQHIEGDDFTPLEWVLKADIERTSLLEDEALITSHMYGTAIDALPDSLIGVNLEVALAEVYERMELIGVSSAEVRARKILAGLGFTPSTMLKPTNKLSGGWAMRAALAAAVFVRPNLLLLDEPTNHLDLHALVWLENWLNQQYNGIAIIVSHDRFFLESVCTDIIELRSTLAGQLKNSLDVYSMDYKSYEIELQDRKIVQERARAAYEKEKDKLKEFISREGRKFDNPAHQAQRRMKLRQLEKLVEVEEVEEESELIITLPSPQGYFDESTKLISINDIDYGFPDEDLLFRGVQFRVGPRSRICILGKNGCGKTTLLQLLTGELDPVKGSVSRNPGCRIAMLQQHHYRGEQLDPYLTALEHMRRMPQDETTAVGVHDLGTRQEENAQRSYLANFGVTGWRATIPVRLLSGGQKMRVAMAVSLYRKPDLIILDEPTNHLDRDTVRALAEALEKYEGAIVVVSHDEDFVSRVLTNKSSSSKSSKSGDIDLGGELWVLSKCQLRRFDGSFREYKKLVMKKVKALDESTVNDAIS